MTVRELRKSRHITLRAMAAVGGMSYNTAMRLDQGYTDPKNMYFSVACQLAQGLGMTVDELARKLDVK